MPISSRVSLSTGAPEIRFSIKVSDHITDLIFRFKSYQVGGHVLGNTFVRLLSRISCVGVSKFGVKFIDV